MANYEHNGGTSGHPSLTNTPYIIHEVIDFSTQTNATNDVFRCIEVPANTQIMDAGIEVLTADSAGNSGTVALGDGTTVWVVAAAPTSLGQMTNASVAMIVKGTADTLDVTVGTGAVNGKIRVWAILCDLDNDRLTSQVRTYATV